MNRTVQSILFVFALLFSFQVKAEFGLGPCCSGATCGIVPCDSMCAGPALDRFGQSFSSLLDGTSSEHEALSQEVSATTQTASSFYEGLSNQRTTDVQNVLASMGGMVSKSLMSQNKTVKYLTSQFDAVTNSIVTAIKKIAKVESFAKNDANFGKNSMPNSLSVLTNESHDALDVISNREISEIILHQLISSSTNLKNEMGERTALKKKMQAELKVDFSVANLLVGNTPSDLTAETASMHLWPYIDTTSTNYSARAISLLASTNLEAGEQGTSYNRVMAVAAHKGVADVTTVSENFALNGTGLNRAINENRQLSQSLLSQLIELKRMRNNILGSENGDI